MVRVSCDEQQQLGVAAKATGGERMHHTGSRGDVAAVDTSKFESWPLLRPDELAALPTELLRASVAELDIMCRQASGKDWRGGGSVEFFKMS